MNTIKHFVLLACLSTGIPILAAEPTPGAPTNEAPSAPAATPAPEAVTNVAAAPAAPTEGPSPATNTAAAPGAVTVTNAAAATNAGPTVAVEYGTNGLRVNFRGAPLSLVLDYLSDAAGFVIN